MQRAYLFRLEAPEPAYLWSGVGDIDVPGDTLVGSATTRYRGVGTLTGLPALEAVINGQFQKADFTLSGVDLLALSYASDEADSVSGSIIRIGELPLDDMGQISGAVKWKWEAIADTLSVESQGADNGGRSRSITISAGTAANGRSTVQLRFYTNADQRMKYPTDAFCSFVGGIQNVTRDFGTR